MVSRNGKTMLDTNEQMIVKHGWILKKAEDMNIMVTNSYSKDSYLYLETQNGKDDINKFIELKDLIPYCHLGFSVNGTNIL